MSTVYHYYARYLEHPSGVTDSLDHWVHALEDASVPVAIVAARPRDGGDNEFAKTNATRLVRHIGRSRETWIPIGLLGLLKRGDVLVLHEGWVLSNLVAAASARLKRTPYVVVPHGVYEKGITTQIRDVAGLRAAAERWVLRHAAAVHVFYRGEQDVVTQFARKELRYITIANGAPTDDSAESWRGGGDYFLWIGRFDPNHKGLDNLVRFWSRLPLPRPRLVLAGPDFRNGREQIHELIEQYGLQDDIEVMKRVSGQAKTDLIVGCRAYLHPSRWESCSIMLLEMLAAGTPSLISSTIHAATELETRDVLRHVTFDDADADGQAALDAVDGNIALGQRARRWASKYGSWPTVGPQYATALNELRGTGR